MKKIFEQIITELCVLKHLGDPTPFLKGAPINVNGSMCTLIYDDASRPDRLFLYVVFGYAASGLEAAIFETLLRQNHVGFEGRGPGFCLSATSGKVGHVIHFDLFNTDADQLASAMVYYANKAEEWRRTYFLPRSSAAGASVKSV